MNTEQIAIRAIAYKALQAPGNRVVTLLEISQASANVFPELAELAEMAAEAEETTAALGQKIATIEPADWRGWHPAELESLEPIQP